MPRVALLAAPLVQVRLPLPPGAKGKQVRVDFKRNWLTVYAPARACATERAYATGERPPAAASPPREPTLDFQLHGAVDPERCDCSWLKVAPIKRGRFAIKHGHQTRALSHQSREHGLPPAG